MEGSIYPSIPEAKRHNTDSEPTKPIFPRKTIPNPSPFPPNTPHPPPPPPTKKSPPKYSLTPPRLCVAIPHYYNSITPSTMSSPSITEGHKILHFLLYTMGIYACFITGSIFQQKMYKVPYPRNSPSPDAPTTDIFTDKITPFGVTSGLGCLLGFLMLRDEELSFDIPLKMLGKVAFCDIMIHVCLTTALLRTTYTTVIIVNTCSLLSVVLVGSFLSGVKDTPHELQEIEGMERRHRRESEKIGPEKLKVCGVVCLGIVVFSYFAEDTSAAHQTQQNWGGGLFTALIFGLAITLQGFRPDFIAQIKQQYHPSSLFLYFSNSGTVFLGSLLLSLLSWQISYFLSFILSHDAFLFDLTCFGLLNSLGSMFSYKLINLFRQHVYPLVANTRKCLTVCVNILWFGHHLQPLQWVGVALVFGAILSEVVGNYNLAAKIMPNENVRERDGKNYSKIVVKEEGYREGGMECGDVEGI